MSGTNKAVVSKNVLAGESVLTKALENANESAIKIEGEGKKKD